MLNLRSTNAISSQVHMWFFVCGWRWKADISLLFSHKLTSRLLLSFVFSWYAYLPIIYGQESWEISPMRTLKSPRTITKSRAGIQEMVVWNSSYKLSLDSNRVDSVGAYADMIVICGLQRSVMVIIRELTFATFITQLARWLLMSIPTLPCPYFEAEAQKKW